MIMEIMRHPHTFMEVVILHIKENDVINADGINSSTAAVTAHCLEKKSILN